MARARALVVTAGALVALAVAATLLGLRAAERPLGPAPRPRWPDADRLSRESGLSLDEAKAILERCGGNYGHAAAIVAQAQSVGLDPLAVARTWHAMPS